MFIKLPYGENIIEFNLDSNRLLNIISPSEIIPSKNPAYEVERALKMPIEGKSIAELSLREKSVSIAVDDNTRTTPSHLILSSLLNSLKKNGVKKDKIKIIVALGTHRPMTEPEMKEKYGFEIVEKYEIVNHVFSDESLLKHIGNITGNVPVLINKEFLKSDIRIATGNIIPHFNSGWSAGAKILLPGLAGEETVGRLHVHSSLSTPNGLGLVDNPTRRLINAFGVKVNIHLLVNTVITRNKDIIRVFTGHFIKAHREGVKFASKVYSVPINGLADITISSSYPCDIEFWQGQKGLFSADLATKVGGGIVIVTPCYEGVSVMHSKWIEYLQHDTEELKRMYDTKKVKDLVALGLALNIAYIRERHPICIISKGISDHEAEKMRFQKFDRIEDAVKKLTRRYGSNSKINVLTHGGETYPILR